MDDAELLNMSVEKKLKVYSIVQITSATVSILASATLIVMICRSHQKLSTPLHRLLLGLSIADIIASLAMAFASTLSPPDHLGWNGFGNMSLCRAQGFIIFFAQNASPLYNCSLCLYYLIEIKYTQWKVHMNKIEVCLHLTPILIPLSASISILALDGFQPSAANCYVSVYSPFECRFDPEVECDEGVKDIRVLAFLWIIHSCIIIPVVISVSMLVIYREVAAQERRNNHHRFSFTSTSYSQAYSHSRKTIAARNRAAAYSLSWLLCWSSFFAIIFKKVVLGDEHMMPFILTLVHHLLSPLQGLFNFIVYLYPKIQSRLRYYKRGGVAQPQRLLLALRDSLVSRGRPPPTSGTARSRWTPSTRQMSINARGSY